MLSTLVRLSIKFRGVIVAMAMLLMAYSIYRLSNAGLDIFPEFSPNLIVVQTEAPGYSTEQVETLVTRPIESSLAGLIGIDYIRSESIQGLSVVNVYFDEDTDIYRNRQLLSERLSTISNSLPEGVGPAAAVPLASSSATILTMGVTSSSKDLMELRSIVDWNLAPKILSVPGVADVNIFGGEIKQLQIQIDTDKLQLYEIGINEIAKAAKKTTGIMGAGFVENDNQRLTLSITGLPKTLEELENIIVKQQGDVSISFADIADIKFGSEPMFSKATVMGHDGIVIMVIGQYGANTLTWNCRTIT